MKRSFSTIAFLCIAGLALTFIIASDDSISNPRGTDKYESSTYQYESVHAENSFTSEVTFGEKNALQTAILYLNAMAFSYSGLIEQLEYEGYTNSEATYAANNCGADWYEQAVLSAKEYLNSMSFSRQGLIEQLEYEGFTYEQAVYGVDHSGY